MTHRKQVGALLTGIVGLLLNVADGRAQQGAPRERPLPPDTSVRIGKLANGLTYYIRANAKPQKHAELRLVVRAGSNQEDPDQRGLAHFVEHMAFNGTKRFPGNAVVGYLESIGVQFGADLNASTTFDRTTYELRVPTDNAAHLSKAFDVMEDWASALTFDSAEVADERGVILEERRRSLGTATRIRDQQMRVQYEGSRYAERIPIGLPEIIETANPTVLKRFYRDWYRPNLMAVIAVGDFAPAEIEATIRERFSKLRNPASERKRETYTIPGNADPRFHVIADSEIGSVGVTVQYRFPKQKLGPTEGMRLSLAQGFFLSAVNQRLREVAQTANPPFLSAQVAFGMMGERDASFAISVGPQNQMPARGVNAALAEVERIARFGITDAEFSRMRTTMLAGAERAYADRGNVESGSYAESYVNLFASAGDNTDPLARLQLFKKILPTIGNADVQRLAALWRTKENRVVLVTVPRRSDVLVPSKTSLLASFDDVQKMELAAHDERTNVEPIIRKLPSPGSIVSARKLDQGVTEWTLSNGIRVLLRPSKVSGPQVIIQGESPGGFYLNLERVGAIPAQTVNQIIGIGGAGTFSATDLGKRLAGRAVQVNWNIGPYSESLNGGAASWGDVETAFQLMYLSVTEPRIDSAAVSAYVAQLRLALANHVNSPEQAFQDTITYTMAQHHPLVRDMTSAMIDSINPEKSLQVFRDRFGDMSDFRFVIVGNFDPDSLAPLVNQYLATLPGGGRIEVPKDPGIRPPTGMVYKTVRGGSDPKAINILTFTGTLDPTRVNQWHIHSLARVIELRLTQRLREQLGGTYSVQVQSNTGRVPYASYSISINFITAPERAEELTRATLAVLDTLQLRPALESDVGKVRESQLQSLRSAFDTDEFWLQRIRVFDEVGLPFSEITDDSLVRNWTAADVQAAARRYLDLKGFIRFELLPNTTASAK